MSKEFDLLFVGPDSVLKEYFRDIADGYSFREAADGSIPCNRSDQAIRKAKSSFFGKKRR